MTGSSTVNTANSTRSRGFAALAATWFLAAALSPFGLSPMAMALAQDVQPSAPNGAGAAAQPAPAQPGQPQPPPPAAQAAPQESGLFPTQPPPAEKPGFIYAFGRWWDSTRGKFEDLAQPPNDATKGVATTGQDAMRGAVQATQGAATATQDAFKNAAQATKDAATALFRLPATRVFEVHQRCDVAPNGAPDCRMAATSACRAKGFGEGHPIDVQSSQNCPPAVWMSGRQPAAGECPEETVVLMAACQ